jgi:hypothetical protein
VESRITLPPFAQTVRLARLDEQPLERLHAEPETRPGGSIRVVRITARPKEIITLRIDV